MVQLIKFLATIGDVRIRITIVKIIIIVFSVLKHHSWTSYFQNKGLNSAVKIANGATEISPPNEPSNSPIL